MSIARYFAVDDPLRPGELSFWYVRTARGRATLEDWPPGARTWGIGSNAPEIGAAIETIQSTIHADPDAAGLRFSQHHGLCFSCGLPLTDDESRKRGLGPDCRRRVRLRSAVNE